LLSVFVFFPALVTGFLRYEPSLLKRAIPVLALLVFVIFYQSNFRELISNMARRREDYSTWENFVESRLAERPGCLYLIAAAVPTKVWANYVGGLSTEGFHAFTMNRLYPNFWGYDFESGKFMKATMKFDKARFDEVADGYKCILFYTNRSAPEMAQRLELSGVRWTELGKMPEYGLLEGTR
jgi:hypothetical protein